MVKMIKEHSQQLEYEVAEIVVGRPLMMSGRRGYLADEVVLFMEKLKTQLAVPIIAWDERLSSVQAHRSLEGLSQKKRSAIVDKTAAVIILQSYLDRREDG